MIQSIPTTLNVDVEEMKSNVCHSSRLDIPWLTTLPSNAQEVMICGGAPSLLDDVNEIYVRAMGDAKIIAINQAANVLGFHRIRPDYQLMMDALPQSVKFLQGNCGTYLLGSQCNPMAFAVTRSHPRVLFNALSTFDVMDCLPEEKRPNAFLIGGGATALTRSLCVAYALGFRTIHIYGADSSIVGTSHHAYEQEDDDGLHETIVVLEGKEYQTSIPMAGQVIDFILFAKAVERLGATVHIHGAGLLPDAYIVSKRADAPIVVV